MHQEHQYFNPFPGLRPFEQDEDYLFFGRDGQSDEILRRLRLTRFVAVVGVSGCGKSSLVRAGLLPSLHGGLMSEAGSDWRIALFRPGNNPIGNLASALNTGDILGKAKIASDIKTKITEATLRRGNLGLIEVIKRAKLPSHENLLVVIDQFEEIFRFKEHAKLAESGDEAAAFVKLLLEATHQKEIPIYVVLTMRSDFLGECAQFRDLPETINDGQYLVPRMTRDQIREAITGPITVGGAEITNRLVQRLLNDVGDNPDQLPILQHALMRTWDYWSDNRKDVEPIDSQHYENIGGMDSALSLHADEAYNELTTRNKKIAEILFKRLTEKGPDNREVRHSAKVQEICEVAQAKEIEVIDVIENFRSQGRSFLMPPPDIKLNNETLIDISHESLIRNWKRLKDWVDEEAQSAQIYRRLAETAALYSEKKAGLLHDPELQIDLLWYQQNNPNKIWARRYNPEYDQAIHFLDESKRNRDAEVSAKERRQKKELRRTRIFAGILAVAFLISLAFGYFAFTQWEKAKQKEAEAQVSAVHAKKSEEIAKSEAQAKEKARIKADSLSKIAQEKAEMAKKNEAKANAAKDAETIARAKADTLSFVFLARALAGLATQQAESGDSELAALLARHAYLFHRRYEGEKINQAIYDALCVALKEPVPVSGHKDWVRAVEISPDGEKLASGSADGAIHLLDIHPLKKDPLILRGHTKEVRCLAFSPEGYILASGSDDRTVNLWNTQKPGSNPVVLKGHKGAIWSVAFNREGNILASGGADSTICIWKLNRFKAILVRALKHDAPIKAIDFNPTNNNLIAAGIADENIWFWDLRRSDKPLQILTSHEKSTEAIAFSPNGRILVSGHENGAVLLWDMDHPEAPKQKFPSHKNTVSSVKFDSKGKMLASGSLDSEVRIWDLRKTATDNFLTLKHESGVWAIAFSPDDKLLVSGCRDKNIYFWTPETSCLAQKACEKAQRNLSKDEWRKFIDPEIDYELTCPDLNLDKGNIPEAKK